MDDPIFEEAKQLKPIKPDADLWDKIEALLIKEDQAKNKNTLLPFFSFGSLMINLDYSGSYKIIDICFDLIFM